MYKMTIEVTLNKQALEREFEIEDVENISQLKEEFEKDILEEDGVESATMNVVKVSDD